MGRDVVDSPLGAERIGAPSCVVDVLQEVTEPEAFFADGVGEVELMVPLRGVMLVPLRHVGAGLQGRRTLLMAIPFGKAKPSATPRTVPSGSTTAICPEREARGGDPVSPRGVCQRVGDVGFEGGGVAEDAVPARVEDVGVGVEDLLGHRPRQTSVRRRGTGDERPAEVDVGQHALTGGPA
ncbi:MAG: hypothetical protein ACR2MA_12130 [Egibacteraceae bacterium]